MGNQTLIRLNRVDYSCSICDGPGIRTIVFVQGCTRHCPGCHNPETWNPTAGYSVDVSLLAKEINEKSYIKRVTISGGEPLEQLQAVIKLVNLLTIEGFDVCLYTSYSISDVPNCLREKLYSVKTGEFRKELITSTTEFIGSSNQVFHNYKEMSTMGAVN